jgi:thiamine transport system ATP-binding protein
MLDEPLGSLDAGLRERLVREVHDIIKQTGLTALYVTHDQAEAFAIADRIALLQNGKLAQSATPQELYYRPVSRYVATFLGLTNFLDVERVVGRKAITDYGDFVITGSPSHLLIHPDGLSLAEDGIPATVRESIFQGGQYQLLLDMGQDTIWRTAISGREAIPSTGENVHLSVDPAYVIPLTD